MAEPDAPRPEADAPPPSVAQEAALLLDLLAQRSSFGTQSTTGGADATGHQPTGSEPGAGDGATPTQHECTCGGTTPASCRLCPVCQLIAFVQKVNPETIDRIADFATFAASALRDVATAQRTSSPTAPTTPTGPTDATVPTDAAPAGPTGPGDSGDGTTGESR